MEGSVRCAPPLSHICRPSLPACQVATGRGWGSATQDSETLSAHRCRPPTHVAGREAAGA
eukprot:10635271-Alexandrium_andersonii.AAC.1